MITDSRASQFRLLSGYRLAADNTVCQAPAPKEPAWFKYPRNRGSQAAKCCIPERKDEGAVKVETKMSK